MIARRCGPAGGPTVIPPHIIIGNPDNRRVALFQRALERQGGAPATVVPYLELLEQGPERLARLPHAEAVLRLDSAGESFAVERELLRLGHDDARRTMGQAMTPEELDRLRYQRGRILNPRQSHLGFLRLLDRIGEVLAQRPGWRPLTPLSQVAQLFDKRVTSRRYAEAGIPVPAALDGVESGAAGAAESLLAPMGRRGWRSAFVKLSCSSSASCLAVLQRPRWATPYAMTTTEMTARGWFNSLRVRRVSQGPGLEALLGFLLRQGSQIERHVPKARLDRAFFDCRVLVVAGEPAFVVLRQSRHPITNLHLGGWRGDLAQLKQRVPADLWRRALDDCARVARLHGAFQLGVDLMLEAGWRGHRILEANAFGDLLPNLERDGQDVYEWQVNRVGRWLARG